MADIAGETRGAEALADLAEALSVADDDETALTIVARHLPRVGVDPGELDAIAAAAAHVRDTWLEGQVTAPAPVTTTGVRRLVTTLLATQLRALRMLAAQEAMAEERAVLHAVTHRLNEAATMEAALRVFRLPAPASDEASISLCSTEDDADGAPTWMTVVAALPAAGRNPVPVGTRFHLPTTPASKWLLAEPGTPVLIGSFADDPRIDEATRETYLRMGVGSALMMALTVRGRIAGTLSLSWSRPLQLGARERRLYQALARHAALLVDNNTMIERLQTTLGETRQQGQLLATVLDHAPVGVVCLEADTRRVLLANPAGQALIGGDASTMPAHALYPGTDMTMPFDDRPAARAIATGQVARAELDLMSSTGERRSVEVVGVPLLDADGTPSRVVLVLSDITARKHEAELRAHLQDEVIRVQAAALAERSSPLIPITRDILVMPLIGTIDADRGDQILETVLTGTRLRGARVTIIDVTGVPSIDTRAAAVLTGAARALRLLGVEPVLSGIGPGVAQALVDLDVPLAGITTCGTLQAGIALALRRLGKQL